MEAGARMKESAIQWRGPGPRRPSRGVAEELIVSQVTEVPSEDWARLTASISTLCHLHLSTFSLKIQELLHTDLEIKVQ